MRIYMNTLRQKAAALSARKILCYLLGIELLLCLCWGIFQVHQYRKTDTAISFTANELSGLASPAFTLSKGVYHFTVNYTATPNAKAGISYLHTRDKVKYLYEADLNSQTTSQTSRIYAPDTASVYFCARLTGDASENDSVQIDSFSLQKSPLTCVRSLCTLLLFLLSADFWGLSLFYYYRSHTRLAGVLWGGLLFLTLLLSIPLFRRGLSNGVDLTFHLMRIEGLYEGLLSGQFPVKIQPGWLNGYGYPVSVFYGDFMLYFPALLRLCGYSIEESFKIFLFFLNLATVLVTYHCLCRLSRNRLAAFTCTVLYCANLYRMMTMYGAPQIGCASAILFYPLVITGLYLLFSDTKQDSHSSHAWIYLVIGYTGILQTHIISCFLFALITILWAAFSVKKLFTRQVMLQLGKTILCVLPLNLGFLVPFVHYYTQKSKLNITAPLDLSQIDYASYYAKYQREGWSLESLLSGNEIGYCLAFCILLCLLLFPYLRRHLPYQERLLFLLCITALALSSCYLPYWRLAAVHPVFAYFFKTLQYSERFLSILTCLLAFFLCMVFTRTMRRRKCLLLCASVLCTLSFFQSAATFNSMENTVSYTDFADFTESTIGNGEYLPLQTDTANMPVTLGYPEDCFSIENWNRSYLSASITLLNHSPEPQLLTVPLLHYQGYQAEDSDTQESFEVFSGDNNRVAIVVPANYSGTLTVHFQKPWFWILAEIISLLSLLVLVLYCGSRHLARKIHPGISSVQATSNMVE